MRGLHPALLSEGSPYAQALGGRHPQQVAARVQQHGEALRGGAQADGAQAEGGELVGEGEDARGGGGGQPREDNYRGMERVKATECTTKTRPGRQMKFSKVVEWAKRAVGRQGGRAAG